MERLSEIEKKRREYLRHHGEKAEGLSARYEAWIRDERQSAADRIRRLDTEIAYEKMLLTAEQEKSRADSVNGERRSTPESRQHAVRIQGLLRQKKALAGISPDAFYMICEEKLLKDLEDERNGRLIDVPYLTRARKQIEDSLLSGIPVYLVGHLGSGKTQLAVEAARDFSRGHARQKRLLQKMTEYREMHPEAKEEESLSYFGSILDEESEEKEASITNLMG